MQKTFAFNYCQQKLLRSTRRESLYLYNTYLFCDKCLMQLFRWHVPIQIKLTSFIMVAARKRKHVAYIETLYITIIRIWALRRISSSHHCPSHVNYILYLIARNSRACETTNWNMFLCTYLMQWCLKVSVKTILCYVLLDWPLKGGKAYRDADGNGIVKSLATSV